MVCIALGFPALALPGDFARQLNDAFAAVYEKVAPSVVVIEVESGAAPAVTRLPRGLDFFFRMPDGTSPEPNTEQGSGFIFRPDGYIITNNHVVQNGEGGRIVVRLKDGRKFPAQLVGRDEIADIAVLKIEADGLPALEMADSEQVRVGQFAFAIGAPFDLPYTFTVGVVSAKGRSGITRLTPFYEEYIQTDASINPGNSGGPLCDLDGRVIGVNTLISGINRGLGFAVPSNIARNVAEQLIEKGRVSRPWLGISIVGLSENRRVREMFPGVESGVLVESIEANAPAHRSRLQPGDVILEVDGVRVSEASDLQREILKKRIGQRVRLDVWRQGRVVAVDVETGEQPDRFVRASSRATPSRPPQVPSVPAPPASPPPAADPRKADPSAKSPPTPAPALPPGGVALHGMVLSEREDGVVVTEVQPGSAAEVAGLQVGDRISEAGGQRVRTLQDVAKAFPPGSPQAVLLMVEREGRKTFAILKP